MKQIDFFPILSRSSKDTASIEFLTFNIFASDKKP